MKLKEKLFYHYFSLFQNNYKLYIRDGKEITYKKYLYSMRGLLNALYVLKFDKIPPLLMRDSLQAMQSHLFAMFYFDGKECMNRCKTENLSTNCNDFCY